MKKKSVFFFVVLLGTVVCSAAPGSASESDSAACQGWIKSMKQTQDKISPGGGVWDLFERSDQLRKHSPKAIQLDSKINETIGMLQYLCETLNGVPFNELAAYISKNLAEKGPEGFRKELLVEGKPVAEIDRWFRFMEFALNKKDRKLEYSQLKISLNGAKLILEKYAGLAAEASHKDTLNPVLKDTQALIEEIDHFLSNDPYMSLAIQENAQVPYWDIDENYGGS